VDVSSSNTVAPSPVFGSKSCDLSTANCITSPHSGTVGSPNTINTSEILRAGSPKRGVVTFDLDGQVGRSLRTATQRPREVLNEPNLTTTIENGKTINPRWSPLSKSEEFTISRGTCGLANTQTGNSMKTWAARDTAASAESAATAASATTAASADVKHSGVPDVASAGMFQNQVFFGEQLPHQKSAASPSTYTLHTHAQTPALARQNRQLICCNAPDEEGSQSMIFAVPNQRGDSDTRCDKEHHTISRCRLPGCQPSYPLQEHQLEMGVQNSDTPDETEDWSKKEGRSRCKKSPPQNIDSG
jgi:hypothetical protein